MPPAFVNPERADVVFANRQLVEAIAQHNADVTIRRRRGCDWSAPENRYRCALRELGLML